MNLERTHLKAKFAENKSKLKELDLKVSNLIIVIRNLIDPYEDDVTRLETENALQAVNDLYNTVEEMKELKEKIEKQKRMLD